MKFVNQVHPHNEHAILTPVGLSVCSAITQAVQSSVGVWIVMAEKSQGQGKADQINQHAIQQVTIS
jgi:hypothetical protein